MRSGGSGHSTNSNVLPLRVTSKPRILTAAATFWVPWMPLYGCTVAWTLSIGEGASESSNTLKG